MRTLTILPAALAAFRAVSPTAALADPSGGNWGYIPTGGGHMGYGGWLTGFLMMALFVGLVLGAIVVAIRLFGQPQAGSTHRDARALLDERFARGEIDRAEYEDRRAALES